MSKEALKAYSKKYILLDKVARVKEGGGTLKHIFFYIS